MMDRNTFLLALLLNVSMCHAADIYVNGSLPEANDDNSGEVAQPLKTIQAGVNKAVAGDTVFVMPGVYRETVDITRGGESKEKILKVFSYKSRKAIIRGSDIVADWTLAGPGLFSALWLTKAPVRQEKMFGFKAWPHQVFIDGKLLEHVQYRIELRDNCFWVDRKGKRIYVKIASSEMLNGKLVEVSKRVSWLGVRKANFVHLKGFKMEHSLASVQQPGCSVTGDDNIIEDNEFAYTGAGKGLGFSGTRTLITGNSIHHNGQMGFGGGGRHLIFEKNHVYQNNTRPIAGWESGVGKVVYSSHCIYRGNVFADTEMGPGLWFDIDNYHNVIEKNVFSNLNSNGVMMEISFRNTVRNNLFYNINCHKKQSYGRAAIMVQLSSETRIYNNLFYGTNGYGVHLRWHVRERSNHRYRPEDPVEFKKVHGFEQKEWMGPREQYPVMRNEIFNNVFVNNTMGAIHIDFNKAFTSDNRSDNNLFLDYVTLHPMDGGHRLMEWQPLTGLDVNSIYSKKLHEETIFVDREALDFRLLSNNPGIGKGRVIKELTEDFHGNPRPVGTPPDIGPFRFVEEPAERR
ncbi:MAG: hypothetical protein HN849_12685 [Victivallales bacterium]|nr:hypothetical protein [Victivallales bacterium]